MRSFILALVSTSSMVAAQNNYAITAAGEWSSSASWGGNLPTFDSDARITVEGDFTSTVDANYLTGSLALAAGLAVDATLQCTEFVWTSGDIVFGASGKITGVSAGGVGLIAGMQIGAGAKTATGGEIDMGALLTDGKIQVATDAEAEFQATAIVDAEIDAAADASVLVAASADSTVSTWTGVTINAEATAEVAVAAAAELEVAASGGIGLDAALTIDAGALLLKAGSRLSGAAAAGRERVEVAAGAALEFEAQASGSATTVVAGVEIDAKASAEIKIGAGAIVDAADAIATLNGASSLIVEVGGKAEFDSIESSATATLDVGLSATTAVATGVGTIACNSATTLQGALEITSNGASKLKAGIEYKVMGYASATGSFSEVRANGKIVTSVSGGAGRRLLDDGEDHYEQREDGVYYTPSQDSSAAGLLHPGLAAIAGFATLMML